MLQTVRRPQLRSPPLIAACTRHGRRHGRCDRVMMSARPPVCERLRARVAAPASQQPPPASSPLSPFLLPVPAGGVDGRSATPPVPSRPVPSRSSSSVLLQPPASTAKPTHPAAPPSPTSANPPILPRKSRPRPQLADPPAAGASSSSNSGGGPSVGASPRDRAAARFRADSCPRGSASSGGTRRRGDRPEAAAPGRVRGEATAHWCGRD